MLFVYRMYLDHIHLPLPWLVSSDSWCYHFSSQHCPSKFPCPSSISVLFVYSFVCFVLVSQLIVLGLLTWTWARGYLQESGHLTSCTPPNKTSSLFKQLLDAYRSSDSTGMYEPFPPPSGNVTLAHSILFWSLQLLWVYECHHHVKPRSQSSRALHPFFLLSSSFCPLSRDVPQVLGQGWWWCLGPIIQQTLILSILTSYKSLQ